MKLFLSIFLLLLAGCQAGKIASCEDSQPVPDVAADHRVQAGERRLMGTQFTIQIVCADREKGQRVIEEAFAEVARVEALLSTYRDDSEINDVNRAAGGQPVAVSDELFEVVERSIAFSELTEGAFDITFAGCGRLWSVSQQRIPSNDEIAACLPLVDYRKIELDPERRTIRLTERDMRIGVGGIAKGYGVDRAAAVIEKHGVDNYIVNGGGDIRVSGRHPDERPWKVGIADPRNSGQLLGAFGVEEGAVVSSGDYERFFERDGVRYHHIIDPRAGRPARRSVAVTVIATGALDADAISTGLFVLGPQDGIALVEQLDYVEALIIAPDLTPHASSGFPEEALQ